MPHYSAFQAAVFDVDDTLLDNDVTVPVNGLHERSRLLAIQTIGKQRNIPAFIHLTPQENLDGFLNAKVHTLEAAVWNILFMTGQVPTEEIDPTHELMREIITLKDKLHKTVLRNEGKEVPGAGHFVRTLASHGFEGKLAVASSAILRDIHISLEVIGISEYFPKAHIISKDFITHPKPHPEPYDLAVESLGITRKDRTKVLAFEDDPRGIMSAKAAGLFTCAITTRFDRKSLAGLTVAPDLICESFAAFEKELGLR